MLDFDKRRPEIRTQRGGVFAGVRCTALCALPLLSLFALSTSKAAAATQAGGPTPDFYVSPAGSDSNLGLSARAPFRTLERAQKAARGSATGKVVCILPGTHLRTEPLVLDSNDAGETWTGCGPGSPTLDGAGRTPKAIIINSGHVAVQRIGIRGFSQSGIEILSSKDVQITANIISDIRSTGWSQGAIHVTRSDSDVTISNNHIFNTKYAGIIYENAPGELVRNISVIGNIVHNTCASVKDCGAIYVDDRGHGARNISIKRNEIIDFGPRNFKSKGIYIDDYASFVTAECNVIQGDGDFAVQIHGGDHNIIRRNLFILGTHSRIGLYQDLGPFARAFGMRANRFVENVIVAPEMANSAWDVRLLTSSAALGIEGNLVRVGVRTRNVETLRVELKNCD